MLESVPDCYKNQIVDNYAHALEFVRDRYKTQEMCDKGVDTCFLYSILFLIDIRCKKCITEFVSDWFVSNKILENLCDTLFANDDILLFAEDIGNFTFFVNKMGIICEDLDKIHLDDADFDEHDPESIIHIILLTWCNKF